MVLVPGLYQRLQSCPPNPGAPRNELERLLESGFESVTDAAALPTVLPSGRPQTAYSVPSQLTPTTHHVYLDQVPDADPLAEYGRGWYLSKCASHAHHYTQGSGCVLLADVAVGRSPERPDAHIMI